MKIGILTLPIAENYGGTLQAIALYRLLHNQGHDVILIYKEFYEVLWKKLAREMLVKIPFRNLKNLRTNHQIAKERMERKKFHRVFIEKEIFKISKNLYSKKDLEKYYQKEEFDAVIVGSDQVWRKEYINDKYYKSYFLDFVDSKKTKKLAYAASFGKNYWEDVSDETEISKLLMDFTAISTRELSGTDICRDSFNYNYAKHVLDPTILMSKEFYIDKIILKYDTLNIKKSGLVSYVLDEANEKKEIISYIKNSLSIEDVNHLKGFNTSAIIYSVPEWLNFFLNASFIVTDSFHGMVFSIIFEKNFIVIGNDDRGLDRFKSLLSLLGLENRLILNGEKIKNKKLDDIDYKKVNKIIEKNRKISLDFLIINLNDKKSFYE